MDGTGVGLSLAREIAQAHHGKLELAVTQDDLNRFEISLPLSRRVPGQDQELPRT